VVAILHKKGEKLMVYICDDCENRFDSCERTNSEQKFGQCPGCHSENIKEERIKEDHNGKSR